MAINFQSNVIPAGSVVDPSSGNYLQINSSGQIGVSSVTLPSGTNIVDGVNGSYKSTVAQFHNADNQALGSGYGLCTGGITQILNQASGNLDRVRGAGFDQLPATGITGGQGYKAMAFQCLSTTVVGSAGSATVTLSGATGLKGTNHGVPWKIPVGSELVYDYGGANQENILVTAVNAATPSITATFANTHSANVIVVGFSYNQERDAAGENDGASGSGTAVAAEYEFNGCGPGGANNYDRARNLQAKGMSTATISSGSSQGSTSFTLSSGPPASGIGSLQPGMPILCYASAAGFGAGTSSNQWETAYVGLNYVPGSTTVPIVGGTLASPGQVNNTTYNTVAWDSYAVFGPQGSGFLPFGMGVECDALYNPYDNKWYLPRIGAGNPGALLVSSDGYKGTYHYFSAGNTPAATPTDVFTIAGSPTKTIRVKKIVLGGFATTAGQFVWNLVRRSAGNSGGTSSSPSGVKHDVGNDAAQTATLTLYTANPTSLGTTIGTIRGGRLFHNVTTAQNDRLVFDCCTNQDKAVVLRGAADILAVNGAGGTLPSGAALDIEIEWEEDLS